MRLTTLRIVRSWLLFLAAACLFASPAGAGTWEGWLSDVACKSQDVSVHPVSCMLGCAKGGFGVVLRAGDFLKFDDPGNKKAMELLKARDKDAKEIQVKVSGTLKDQTIEVHSLDPL